MGSRPSTIDVWPEQIASTGRDVGAAAASARAGVQAIATAPALAPETPVGEAWSGFSRVWSRELASIDDELSRLGRVITAAGGAWRSIDGDAGSSGRWS